MNLDEIHSVLLKDKQLSTVISSFSMKDNYIMEPDIFQALIYSIISQQISVKVASVIYKRFLDLYGLDMPKPESILNTPFETLRSVGLSRQKTNYILNISAFFNEAEHQNINWESLSDEEVIQKLTQIKGVGVWTAQMILMFTLNRPDVFPIGDLAIVNGMKKIYDLEQIEDKKELKTKLLEISNKWSPYRTYACLYIWKMVGNQKK